MKTLRLLVTFVLATWVLTAAAAPPVPPAGLLVYSEQGQPFSFALDGRILTRPLARQVRVGLLLPGQHWADVSIPAPYGPPMRLRTSLWLRPGSDNGYVLVLRRGGPQLQPLAPGPGYGGPAYGGQYPAAGGAPGQYPEPAPYPAPGQYDGDDEETDAPGSVAPGYPAYPNGNGYPAVPAPGAYPGSAYPGGNGARLPAGPGGYPGSNYPTAPNGSYPAAPGGNGYYPGNGGTTYLPPLSPADFSGLQQALSQRPFDDERLGMVRQALNQNTVRADELAVLIRTLSFDKSRIALAEFGYAHLADPQNFYRVYDALQYRSSIREVQQALGLPQD